MSKPVVKRSIYFQGRCYPCLAGQTVLEVLLSAGFCIPYCCRSGVCQSCLLQAHSGKIPSVAQRNLSIQAQRSGYFLACQCVPEESLWVDWPGARQSVTAVITEIKVLTPTRIAVSLISKRSLCYHPGQHVQLWRDHSAKKSYYLCSPANSTPLQLWVERCAGGEMSHWLFEQAKSGDAVQLSQPLGSCYCAGSSSDATIIISCAVAAGAALAIAHEVQSDGLTSVYVGIEQQADVQALLLDRQWDFPENVQLITFAREDSHLKNVLQEQGASAHWYLLGNEAVIMPWYEYSKKLGVTDEKRHMDVFSKC